MTISHSNTGVVDAVLSEEYAVFKNAISGEETLRIIQTLSCGGYVFIDMQLVEASASPPMVKEETICMECPVEICISMCEDRKIESLVQQIASKCYLPGWGVSFYPKWG